MSKAKKPRCSAKETTDRAWRGCTLPPNHEGDCRFGKWSLSAQSACARCGHQADPDELGLCAGCERECCMACMEDGTCRACLAEESDAEKPAAGTEHISGCDQSGFRVHDLSGCLQALAKIAALCRDAEEGYRYSDNEGMESRAAALLEKLEEIGEIARRWPRDAS